jgi:energy-coupling factor transporter ATP-binding protein EcfA2
MEGVASSDGGGEKKMYAFQKEKQHESGIVVEWHDMEVILKLAQGYYSLFTE